MMESVFRKNIFEALLLKEPSHLVVLHLMKQIFIESSAGLLESLYRELSNKRTFL